MKELYKKKRDTNVNGSPRETQKSKVSPKNAKERSKSQYKNVNYIILYIIIIKWNKFF